MLLIECCQIATALLKCIIVVNTLPLETNLFETLYSALRKIGICILSLLDVLVCCSHVDTPVSQSWIVCISARNITVSILLFECYQLATALLECIIVVNTLPLEANLFETLYSVFRKIGICFYSLLDFLVCCSHADTPVSQSWIVCIYARNIAV